MVEIATISDIKVSDKYPFVRTIYFKDRKYRVVLASTQDYSIGEEVLYIPDGTILPPHLLKYLGVWNASENKGYLHGSEGNRVRPYKYNGDDDYYSFGMIGKLPPNGIYTYDNRSIDLRNSLDIDKDLQVVAISKGLPYYYKGEMLMADIKLQRPVLPDIESVYTDFTMESEVYAEAIVPGRSFYTTVSNKVREPRAFGKNHNVFITTPGLKKYVYFADTHSNRISNPFIKVFIHSRVLDLMESMVTSPSMNGLITCEMTQYVNTFGKEQEVFTGLDSIVLTDVFIGSVPWGRYLMRDEVKRMAKFSGVALAPEIYEGEFDYDLLAKLAEDTAYGLIIRSFDNQKRAYLFNKYFRTARVRETR